VAESLTDPRGGSKMVKILEFSKVIRRAQKRDKYQPRILKLLSIVGVDLVGHSANLWNWGIFQTGFTFVFG